MNGNGKIITGGVKVGYRYFTINKLLVNIRDVVNPAWGLEL
jgi:hypothetical protein